MQTPLRLLSPLLLLSLALPSTVSGATVTFNGFQGLLIFDSAFMEGYQFTVSPGLGTVNNASYGYVGLEPGNLVDNGTPALNVFNGAVMTMTQAGGGAFSVQGFDVAQTFLCCPSRNITTLQVLGLQAGGGVVSQTLAVNAGGFQGVTLSGFGNVTSVQFIGLAPLTGNAPEFQLDNIATAAPVPEPAAVGLLALGAGAMPLVLRRRR